MIIKPCISLILVTDNNGSDTVDALLSQGFTDFELLVLDRTGDQSFREKCHEIQKRKDPRIRWVPCKKETLPQAFNQGIKLAKGQYFSFLTDKVCWNSDALHQLYLPYVIRIIKCGCVYGDIDSLQEGTGERAYLSRPWCLMQIKYSNLIPLQAALISRKAIDLVGAFSEEKQLEPYFDWDFWIRLSRELPVKKIPYCVGYSYVKSLTPQPIDRSWQKRTIPKSFKHLVISLYQSFLFGTEKGLHFPVKLFKVCLGKIKQWVHAGIRKVASR